MKRHVIHSGSCSCTSCVYKSQSKRPSIQNLIQEGSKIDRLFFGKYLPLRERKLLEKLIRTRGVYDDVRNQLLSTSGSSDQTRSDHKMKRKEDDSTEKSSAVLKIVDLVDRGQIGSSNTSKLSSCCSCCSCSSMRKIQKHMEKHPPRVHRHPVPYEEIAKYCAEAEERGKRRQKRLSTKISTKIRAVRFKVKQVRSEPCTCTLSLSSIAKRSSKALIKKVRSKEKSRANTEAQKVVTIERNALKRKICNCSCKIAKLPMKSIKKIKSIRKSTTKSSGTDMGHQKSFRIKKDSLTLFREKLQKKQDLKDWECEPGICVVDECIPEQCLIDIKARGVGETRRKKHRNKISGTRSERTRISTSTRPKKVKKTDSRVQALPQSTLGPVTCECKPISKSASSMTSFSKSKASRPLVEIQSTTTDIKVKRPKSAKQKPQVILKDTESIQFHETEGVQASPKPNLAKSDYSMTDIPKTQAFQSVSKTAIKRPVASKPKSQIKELVIQEKSYKTERHKPHEIQPVQTPTKSKLGYVICECEPSTRSTSSMTISKQSKTAIRRPVAPKSKPTIVIKETVIQEKSYKTDRHKPHEIQPLQTPTKSKLGHVICECKPSTRSSSSMTISKQSKTDMKVKKSIIAKREKPYKTNQSRKERYEYYETESKEDTKEPGKQAVKLSSSFKFEIEFSKTRHPALTDKELFEHVKVKRAKRNKRTQGKSKQKIKYQHSKIQVSGTSSKGNRGPASSQESQISYLRDSTSQTSKYTSEILPFPRECDPLMCVPYECDPEDCARILLSRSKSRGKSSRSSTDRVRRKSAGSTTSSLKTSSKSKYIQSKSTETFKPKTRELPKERPHQMVETDVRAENSYPQKQAVRIGSSFSFNIEFYKENPPIAKTNDMQDLSHEPQKKMKPQLHRKKNKERGHGARNKNYRHISSQSRTSQSIKNIQVGHRLKRCFCTLKLLQKKKPKVKHAVSKKTMAALHNKDLEKRARMRQTQTKSSGIAYVIPPITSPPPPILPYECEPFFCTPGECNPYECAERIKVRNHKKDYRFSSKETNTVSVPRKSALTFISQDSSKSSSKKIQSSSHEYRKHKTKRPHLSRTDTKVSCEKTEKQAVRIGSSFSFNIEFSKDNIDQQIVHEKETAKAFKPDKPIKQERKRIQQKGIKVHKPRVRHATSETTKSVKAKQTSTPPFLQRCFCTLKLFNQNKKKAGTVTPLQNKNDLITNCMCVNKSITTNRANISYHHAQSKPLRCDPDECAKRHMKLQNKYSNTGDLTTRSSETSRTITTSKSRYTKSYIRGSRENIKKRKANKERKRESNYKNVRPSPSNKQAVRVGSSFSFNVEFYKENPSTNDTRGYVTRKPSREKPIKQNEYKKVKVKQIGSQQLKPRHHHRAMHAETKGREKGIYVGSAIKRCFCTLKFHKKGKNERLQKNNNVPNPQTCECKISKTSYQLPNRQKRDYKNKKTSYQPPTHKPCVCKSTSTKRSQPTYDLKSYECAPDFCVPGMCNPYACYEEIKRRDMKPQNCDCKSKKTSYEPPNPQTCECKTSKTSYRLPNPQKCDCKSTSRKKSKPTYDLKNYECAPDFCVPGMCNPYACYEEIKRRDMNPQNCDCKSKKTSYHPPSTQLCDCKSTNTKKRSKATNDLKNYECAPDFCVPGLCDPHECYKEIKRRDMKRLHDRCVCTERRKRKSIVSMTTSNFIGNSRSKITQSKIIKQIPKHDHKVKAVHRDRDRERPTSSFSPSRQAVCRIGSNFSFNIEFFKDRSAPSFPDTAYKIRTPKYNTVSDTTTVKKIRHRGTKHKRAVLQHQLSQASNIIRREDKASNVGFILKRCFCTLGLQKKNIVPKKQKREFRGNPPIAARYVQVRVDQHKNKKCNFEDLNVAKTQELDIIKDYDKIKPRSRVPYRTLFAEECLKLNLQEGNRPFDENIFRQHLAASSTFTKSTHVKSRIDFNIGILNNKTQATTPNFGEYDEYQFRNLLNDNIQKNSFYQSFYALNLQVSNLKNVPVNYVLKDNECEPGFCIPYKCDPVECLKRINSRLQRSKLSGTARPKTKSVTSVTKSQLESKSTPAEANLKKYKQRPSQKNYSSNGNGQQETSSHSSRQVLSVGSDFSFAMEFYKDTKPRNDDDINTKSKKPKETKVVATRNLQSRNTDTQINDEGQNKTTGISPLLKRCFCTLSLKNNKVNRSQIKQKTKLKQAANKTEKNTKKTKLKQAANKTEKNTKETKQKKDESTMANKPYGNVIVNKNRMIMTDKLEPYECAPNVCIPGECDPHECYKLIQKRLKKLQEHGVGTDNPKYKSTSSLAKKRKKKYKKNITTNCLCECKPEEQRESVVLKPSLKQGVTFGSNISFSMEFYRDPSPSANFPHTSAWSDAQSRVCHVNKTNMKGSGDNRKKTRDIGQTGILQPNMEEAGTNVANMLNRCFCTLKLSKSPKGVNKRNINKKDPVTVHKPIDTTKNVKSILKPYECEPKTCVIDKCSPIKCDKRIKKRQLRSKSTKVNRKREATCVKSAVMDKSTATKGKRLSKSFECEPYVCIPDKCDPHECIEKLKAQGIIFPDVSERASKKVKHARLSTQKVETKSKSINTNKESILKRCFCVLKLIKSKPPSSTLNDVKCVCESKTDLNKLIKKCLCTLKLVKGGKELAPKESKQRIIDSKTRDKLKKTRPKPALKLEKKGADKHAVKKEKEMETLMPYSKKKFKKLESKTIIAQASTNTVGFYPCTCPKKKFKQQTTEIKKSKNAKANKKNKHPEAQNVDQLVICPACKDSANAKSIKTSKQKKAVKKSPNEQMEGQSGLCPVCKTLVPANLKKKQDEKRSVHPYLTPNKPLKEEIRGDDYKRMGLQNGQLDVCSCCNSMKCNLPPPSPPLRPSPFGTVMNILKCKYSGFLIGCCKEKEKKEIEKEEVPLFEVYVNKSTMNIMNRNEVLANLGVKGKESAIMKKARIAGEQGKVTPPLMELLVDKDSATIVNPEEIIKTMIPFEERKSGKARSGKSGGVKICSAKCQSLRAAEIHKKPPAKTTKSERTAPSRPHCPNCQCCECLSKRKRVKYATLPVQKSGAGDSKPLGAKCSMLVGKLGMLIGIDAKSGGKDGKPIGETGKLIGKDGKPIGKDGKSIGKDGKPIGKDGKPIGKDGKPIGKDGKPIGKDGKPIGKDGKPIGAKVAIKPRKLKPCICGSIACKKNWDKLVREAKSIKTLKIKPCVCGSDVCKYESSRMPDVHLKAAKKAQRKKDKALKRIEDEKKYQKERLIRKKLYAKQDAKLWQRRKKQDRRDMKLVKKYEDNTRDCVKAAESLVDIGKFGAKALCDLMRSTCRIIQHPRDGVYLLKDAKKYPRRTAKEIEQSCEGMGLFATMARVRRRVFSMKTVKDIITKLESYPITNFIIHMADKDPKKRMKKFKKKRLREPMDFECSLFMASLRKRPCLSVYYSCPWFYPHCLSLLTVLNQFTDVLLFILAVGVWSPCIILMELCRAMMCCCLCTG